MLHQVTVFDSLQVGDSVGSFSWRRYLFWLSFSSIIPYKNMWHPFWKKKSLLEDWADIMWIHYQIQKRCLVYYAKNISLFHVMTDFYISISGLVNSCYFYVTFLFIACLEIQSIVDARHDPVNFSHSQQRFTKSSVICRSLVTYFWHLIILSCPLWVPFKTQNDHILTAERM